MTCGIYMIQNKVNGKMYIGQAVDIEGDRWIKHKAYLKGGYHVNKHLQNAWNKYGKENFEFSILMECEENQLNTYEQYYIFELMTYDRRVGYNNAYGGDSGRPTEEAKRKMSEAVKGENNPMYRKHHTEEARKKMSENRPSKPVVQINPNTNEVITYLGVREAARQTGFGKSYISECCRGKRKAYKGYKWMFLSDYEKLRE